MTQDKIIASEVSSNINSNKFEMKDFISTMPNEIIQNILSRLTMKEAGRTSVLSTTWRYQWTNFSGVLDFDHSLKNYVLRRLHVGVLTKCIVFVSEWERFMASLEHVMKSLKCSYLQGFRVCIDLGNPGKLQEWLKFASERNVQVLDLDFTYHFTEPFYGISYNIRNLLSCKKFEMKSLRVLRLACVDLDGEVLQCFLATCPLLETIRVIESTTLVRLKVWGQGLRLKHLELVECNILYLDICAENLMTFRYCGNYGKFNFESVPNLEEVSFGGRYASYLQANMYDKDFFGVLLQVHILKLNLSTHTEGVIDGLPVFDNVRQLELQIPHICGANLGRPVSVLSAFPSIRILKIKFMRSNLVDVEHEWKANLKQEYPILRELEVSGYRRDPSQIELLLSIFAKAPNLNRILVDPLSSDYVDRSPDVKATIRNTRRDSTLWLVDALKPHVPPSVELIVL